MLVLMLGNDLEPVSSVGVAVVLGSIPAVVGGAIAHAVLATSDVDAS